MRVRPEGTVTFLFTDIEGSTRILQTLGQDRYVAVLERHNQLVRQVCGDAVVSTEGDSFFCVFDEASGAVDSAVEIQRLLRVEDWGPGLELRVRMGLHTGLGVRGGDDYVGLDVHRAARVASAAHGGQILVTASTKSLVEDSLSSGGRLEDLGDHRLKDLSHPVRLYQLTVSDLQSVFPPPNTMEAPLERLPEYLTMFIGRENEVDAVIEALARSRLVTLTGMAGSGKTRLAVEASKRVSSGLRDGVCFVPLENTHDKESVARAVASELGLTERLGQPVSEMINDYLGPRDLLLVLDNCEQAVGPVAAFAVELLAGCPKLGALATSREAFRVDGESVVRVGPMSTNVPRGRTLDAEAVRLFVDRAKAANSDFDEDRWSDVCVEICQRLEGIPLAIELAAARSSLMTPDEILEGMNDRFSLLAKRSTESKQRHSTLEAALDWSYDLLDDDSKRLLRSLSVFRGGFTSEAVAAICFEGDITKIEVFDQLAELAEKSLVLRVLDAPGFRFRQLDTIREFALQRLHEAGETKPTEARHGEYFTKVAREQAGRLSSSAQLTALSVLEADHDNLLEAMERAMDRGEPETAASIAGWLSWFWYLHAHFAEGEQWADRLLGSIPPEPSKTWLRLLIGAGQYDFRIGNYERSAVRLQQLLGLIGGREEPRLEMWAHAYLATNELYRLSPSGAIEEAAAAARLAEQLGDVIGLGYSLFISVSARMAAYRQDDRLDETTATELITEFEPVARSVRASGERNMIGHALQTEGILAMRAGNAERAKQAFDEALEAFLELGQIGCGCHCLDATAELLMQQDRPEAATRLILATDSLRREIGVPLAPFEELIRSSSVPASFNQLARGGVATHEREQPALTFPEAMQLARQVLAEI